MAKHKSITDLDMSLSRSKSKKAKKKRFKHNKSVLLPPIDLPYADL